MSQQEINAPSIKNSPKIDENNMFTAPSSYLLVTSILKCWSIRDWDTPKARKSSWNLFLAPILRSILSRGTAITDVGKSFWGLFFLSTRQTRYSHFGIVLWCTRAAHKTTIWFRDYFPSNTEREKNKVCNSRNRWLVPSWRKQAFHHFAMKEAIYAKKKNKREKNSKKRK